MSRAAVAAELQQIIQRLQQACAQGEALAKASGLVDPKWFRGAMTAATMAAGDLQAKDLLAPTAAPIDGGHG